MKINTHTRIDRNLSGEPVELDEGKAVVKLKTTSLMAADERGLIHGGFIFSSADYSAMLAVNHPNVVLAQAQVKFLKPVVEGDILTFEAQVKKTEGKKHFVSVKGFRNGELVFEGDFLCIVPQKHVLDKAPI